MEISDPQFEKASAVAEDLEHLMDEWSPRLNPPAMRRLSPIIRRLLIYGDYSSSWTALGLPGQPYVTASDLGAMLGSVNRRHIAVAFAPPGAEVAMTMATAKGKSAMNVPGHIEKGDAMAVVMSATNALGPMWVIEPKSERNPLSVDASQDLSERVQSQIGTRKFRGLPMSRYLDSPAALIREVEISRQDVIHYVTNKLGGAHFDVDRSKPRDQRLALLDANPLMYAAENGPQVTMAYIELVSICEALVESSDASRFRDVFGKLTRTRRSP